jgi:hypothetical protein
VIVVVAAGAFYKGRGRSRGGRHRRDIIDRNDNVFSIIIVVVRKQESAPFLILLLFTAVMLLLPVRALSQIVYSILCSVPSIKDSGRRCAAPNDEVYVCIYTSCAHVSSARKQRARVSRLTKSVNMFNRKLFCPV